MVDQVGSDADWRSQPLGHWECLARIRQQGKSVSPLLTEVPWVSTKIFRKDWLHVADQGVSADFLGNVFSALREHLPGRNIGQRTAALWTRIQDFYMQNNVQDKLTNLTVGMIKSDKKAPKLRSSAAQCRALIPFALASAEELLSPLAPHEDAIIRAARTLDHCYKALSHDSMFAQDVLEEQSKVFALQDVALRNHALATTGDNKKVEGQTQNASFLGDVR